MRKILRRFGYDLHRVPVASLTLRDLEFDLPILVGNENPVVFDVGANRGQTIDLVRRAFSRPVIFSFEPNPDLLPELIRNYACSAVAIEGVALGNSEGSIDFHVSENSELSSVLAIEETAVNPFSKVNIRKCVSVPLTTLDSYVKQRGLTHIDLLKIDTQGFDLEVLRGASTILKRQGIATLLVEVNFTSLYKGQSTFGDVQQYLKDKRYGLVAFYEVARLNRYIGWATACFQRII